MLSGKQCERCFMCFIPETIATRYCSSCRPIVAEEKRIARYKRWRARVKKQKLEVKEIDRKSNDSRL